MNNLKAKLFAILSLLLMSLCISSVVAQSQYDGGVTTNVAVTSDGTCTVCDAFGITYNIQGASGSSGTITTEIRTANPQPNATPEGITLNHFVVVTFNMNPSDFSQAQIIIPYIDSDVQGMQQPYTIYKYVPATNSYTALDSVLDTTAKTFTVTVNSVDDPLFAIGGATVSSEPVGFSTTTWAVLGSSIVIIVMLVVVGVWYFKKSP